MKQTDTDNFMKFTLITMVFMIEMKVHTCIYQNHILIADTLAWESTFINRIKFANSDSIVTSD